jgi:hypothetical protein
MPMRGKTAYRLKGTDGIGTIARSVRYSKFHRKAVMPPRYFHVPGQYVADLSSGKITPEEFEILVLVIANEDPETAISNCGASFLSQTYRLTYTTVRGCITRLEAKNYLKNLAPRRGNAKIMRTGMRTEIEIGANSGMVLDCENITTYRDLKYISCEQYAKNVRSEMRTECEEANKPKYRNGSLLSGGEQQRQRASTSFLYDSEYLKVSERQHELLTKEFHFDPSRYYPEIHRWLESRDEHAKSPIAVVRAWLTRLGGNGNGTHPSNGNGNGFKSRAEIQTERRQQATEAAIQRTYGRTGPDR